jgi:hypothetical protein
MRGRVVHLRQFHRYRLPAVIRGPNLHQRPGRSFINQVTQLRYNLMKNVRRERQDFEVEGEVITLL